MYHSFLIEDYCVLVLANLMFKSCCLIKILYSAIIVGRLRKNLLIYHLGRQVLFPVNIICISSYS